MNFPKFQKCLLALTLVCIITLFGCKKEQDAPTAKKEFLTEQKVTTALTTRGSRASASGQGALRLDYMNGRVQHFAFHANTDANGKVSGSFESKSPGQNGRAHGTIDCLTVLPDGKTAIMSGFVTQVIGDGYVVDFGVKVGDPIWLKVQDSGEGVNAGKDLFTDYQFFPFQVPCSFDIGSEIGLDLYPILNGNIQVKP